MGVGIIGLRARDLWVIKIRPEITPAGACIVYATISGCADRVIVDIDIIHKQDTMRWSAVNGPGHFHSTVGDRCIRCEMVHICCGVGCNANGVSLMLVKSGAAKGDWERNGSWITGSPYAPLDILITKWVPKGALNKSQLGFLFKKTELIVAYGRAIS